MLSNIHVFYKSVSLLEWCDYFIIFPNHYAVWIFLNGSPVDISIIPLERCMQRWKEHNVTT